MFVKLLTNWLAVLISAYILPGVNVDNLVTAFVVAIVLGVVNMFIKPIIIILTLPINVLTLGLLTFVINALLVLLVTAIVPGFVVSGFWWALIFSLVLSLVNSFLYSLSK